MNALIKHTLQTLLILFVVISVLSLAEAYAQSVEEHYSEQGFTPNEIAEMQRQASLEWQKEYGDLQPNLTVEAEQYLINYTALLQETINGKH